MDKNLCDLPPAEVSTFCGSLREPLNAPEADREFLLKGDVFQGPDRRLCRTELGRSQPPGNPAEPGRVRHVLFELIFSVRLKTGSPGQAIASGFFVASGGHLLIISQFVYAASLN